MSKKVYFRINKYYGWGVGYYSTELKEEFDKKIDALREELNCDILLKYNDWSCKELSGFWGSLYCHPMNLSGFVSDYQIDRITQACEKVELPITKVDIYDDLNLDNHHELCEHLLGFGKNHTKKELIDYIEKLKCKCNC